MVTVTITIELDGGQDIAAYELRENLRDAVAECLDLADLTFDDLRVIVDDDYEDDDDPPYEWPIDYVPQSRGVAIILRPCMALMVIAHG